MTIRPYRLSGGFFEREEEIEDVKRMVFLSVEGRRSEPSYFQNVNRCLIDGGCRNVLVHVLMDGKILFNASDSMVNLWFIPAKLGSKLLNEFNEPQDC